LTSSFLFSQHFFLLDSREWLQLQTEPNGTLSKENERSPAQLCTSIFKPTVENK